MMTYVHPEMDVVEFDIVSTNLGGDSNASNEPTLDPDLGPSAQ